MSARVALLRRLYEAWNREGVGAFDKLREDFDPDVEFHEPPEFPGAGVYSGIDGFREALSRQLEAWERIVFEPDEFLERGDDVLVTVRVRTFGRETQIETERPTFPIWTIRDGRIVRCRVFFDESAALEELGR